MQVIVHMQKAILRTWYAFFAAIHQCHFLSGAPYDTRYKLLDDNQVCINDSFKHVCATI